LLALLIAGGAVAAILLTRPTTKVVPTVVFEQVSVAQAQVQNAGFNPSLIYRPDSHKSGTVIAQNPLGGAKADEGSTVTLTVSQGPGNVSVPSVADLSQQSAVQAIKSAGLNVSRIQSESSDTVPSGTAIRTEPAAGISVPRGSGVTLLVSSGRAQVNVPDVTGQSEAAARATLVNAGFKVSTTNSPSTTAQPGTVTSQSPSGGSQAPFGSTVQITLATKAQPTTVTVPNVVGATSNAASSKLTAAGFTVRTQTQSTSDRSQDGKVISQSPGANSTANKGSTVTIVVGKLRSETTTTSSSSNTTSTPSHT
jgi:serine/threonine-protein kinase